MYIHTDKGLESMAAPDREGTGPVLRMRGDTECSAFNHARVHRRLEEEVGGHLFGSGDLHGCYGFPFVSRMKGKGGGERAGGGVIKHVSG